MITFDPTKRYENQDLTQDQILDLCGAVPYWFASESPAMPGKEVIKKHYQFPSSESVEATITNDGIMQYPDDPDQYPYYILERVYDTVYQYPYSFVAVVDNKTKESYVVRVD